MSLKEGTYVYLLKISTAHNEKQILLLNLLIDCISAVLTPHILSIKDEYTLCFSNFLIIGLCIFLASSCFDITLVLTTSRANLFGVAEVSDHRLVAEILAPKDFLSKNLYQPLEQVHVETHHTLDFQQY